MTYKKFDLKPTNLFDWMTHVQSEKEDDEIQNWRGFLYETSQTEALKGWYASTEMKQFLKKNVISLFFVSGSLLLLYISVFKYHWLCEFKYFNLKKNVQYEM